MKKKLLFFWCMSVRNGLKFIFLLMDIHPFQHHLLKRQPFLHWKNFHLCEKSVDCMCDGLILDSLFCPVTCSLSFWQCNTALITCIIVSLKSGSLSPPTVFLFYKIKHIFKSTVLSRLSLKSLLLSASAHHKLKAWFSKCGHWNLLEMQGLGPTSDVLSQKIQGTQQSEFQQGLQVILTPANVWEPLI